MKRCPFCGAAVDEGDAFCKHCGAPLDESNAIHEIRKMDRLKLVLLFLLFVCMALGIIYLM